MYLQKLSLVNFKNIETQSFDFQQKINCFVGSNGVGKTNVLDAIYYLSFAKSYFNSVAGQNIRHGQDFFMIEGSYQLASRNEKILCSLKRGQKKILKRNGKPYEKFSEHIGQLPLVIISPADRNLIVEGSETRRKFMDSVISQQDKNYLQSLILYNKIISQRNALLKYFVANRTFDALNLKVYDAQLVEYGTVIYQKRKAFLEEFAPIFNAKHHIISGNKETVNLRYKSQLHDASLTDLFAGSLNKDRMLQYTSSGIHKDDLNFEIDQYPIKKFGSQGQQKTYLIALKLAQFEFIKKQSNVTPILLLDDIFDKLDENRVAQIVALVNNDAFGQIFITDTHFDRTENVLKNSNQEYQIFKL
ncbi:DNA replication/repair protein RecF [Tenacibaculum finnmarkense]|uniref:DNA replication/repair protein RecF n=1 Tax=Tenacibaculum finnmarkense TaxID=2781243 RepID=UPI0007390293|nr:DNA replication/repair protein RecF [Tenacibaculum finnmarkense]ALU74415.1 DNA recombination protein RecF [Tenacibaculum dicentrarchi]MCD8400832.1 DNA replication/repair protein RecF [Tenacibaculum finnmarkense genomovar ulcerans]MCD8423240.1 DNA replication/repair protein RecF [Tenacibaculum finnmarkense genomovar ulcerans]MCD8433028.1 DNA replication/repair protein RecF [Tenacibaculum finnmarkense genomovar ulcerans]MCG8236796.1 DNA replication/repair protein RecF [Tenacibaculum finnmarke